MASQWQTLLEYQTKEWAWLLAIGSHPQYLAFEEERRINSNGGSWKGDRWTEIVGQVVLSYETLVTLFFIYY